MNRGRGRPPRDSYDEKIERGLAFGVMWLHLVDGWKLRAAAVETAHRARRLARAWDPEEFPALREIEDFTPEMRAKFQLHLRRVSTSRAEKAYLRCFGPKTLPPEVRAHLPRNAYAAVGRRAFKEAMRSVRRPEAE